jgi:hypothetical protein
LRAPHGSSAGLAEDDEAALGARQLDHVVEDDRQEAVEVELAVDRLRHALEAQEPVLLLLRLLEVALEVEHHRVLADGVGRRRLLEPDARAAHPDPVARLEGRPVDQVPVEEGPVLAAQVEEQVLGPVALDPAVAPGGPQVEDGDVALGRAPDHDGLLVEVEDRPSLVLVEDETGQGGATPGGLRRDAPGDGSYPIPGSD